MFDLLVKPTTAASARPEPVAVLDIGAAKTLCLIGQRDPHMGVRVLGSGFGQSGGLKGGAVVDLDATEAGIRTAVQKAERAAGVTVQSVHVNLGARSLQSRHVNVAMAFGEGEVTARAKAQLVRAARARIDTGAHAVIHALPLAWSVGAAQDIRDPQGMFGRELGVDMHFVLAELGALRNLATCLGRAHLRLGGVSASPYAAGQGVLSEDERELGCTLIDIGADTTTLAVFRDARLLSVLSLPVGGATLTGDIARGLSTPWEAAERIKAIYGSALAGADDVETLVPCPPIGAEDALSHAPRSQLTRIVRARMEETFELLRDRLERSGLEAFSGRRVVLSGGAAQLGGVAELAELVFDKEARVAKPLFLQGLGQGLSSPAFAVGTGLLRLAVEGDADEAAGAPDLSGRAAHLPRLGSTHPVGRTLHWLRENF